jgi:hypothetical protein
LGEEIVTGEESNITSPDMSNSTDIGDGSNRWDTYNGTSGSDNVEIGDNYDYVSLNSGDDNAIIGNADDGYSTINTGSGNDNIVAGNNWNSVNLGSGNDTAQIGNTEEGIYSDINAGSGDDTIVAGNGYSKIDLGSGNDSLNVGDSSGLWTTIDGGSGNDTITVGNNWTVVDGGSGNDTVIFKGDESNYTIGERWGQTIVTNNESGEITELRNIENIQFGGDSTHLGDESSISYEYDVNIEAQVSDTDSESITSFALNGIPEGCTLVNSNGDELTVVNGSIELSPDQIDGLKIISDTQLSDNPNDSIHITVSATATEENGGDEELQTAVLVDGVVEGAEYETTSGVKGITDENGNFNFRAGDDVTFSVGGVTLGVATSEDIESGKTFLQDIADVDRSDLNDEYLENMAVFLQSIDSDSGDNIVITQEMRDSLADANIDLRSASEEEVQSLVESVGGSYVDENEAMEHVQQMLQEYADMEEGDFDERVDDSITTTEDTNDTIETGEDILTATFGKEPQAGITFETSSGITGVTNENGEFEFNDGDTITFSQNGVVIATIDASEIGDDFLITFEELNISSEDLASNEATEETSDIVEGEEASEDETSDDIEEDSVEETVSESDEISDIQDDSIAVADTVDVSENSEYQLDDDDIELELDNIEELTAIEVDIDVEEEINLDNVDLADMLTHDEAENSISTLLGEEETPSANENINPLDNQANAEEETQQEEEYDPFKALEESSSNMIANIELDDYVDTNHDS